MINTKVPFIPCTSAKTSTSVVHFHLTQTSYPRKKVSVALFLLLQKFVNRSQLIGRNRAKVNHYKHIRGTIIKKRKDYKFICGRSRAAKMRRVTRKEWSELRTGESDTTIRGTRLRLSAKHSDSGSAVRARNLELGCVRRCSLVFGCKARGRARPRCLYRHRRFNALQSPPPRHVFPTSVFVHDHPCTKTSIVGSALSKYWENNSKITNVYAGCPEIKCRNSGSIGESINWEKKFFKDLSFLFSFYFRFKENRRKRNKKIFIKKT